MTCKRCLTIGMQCCGMQYVQTHMVTSPPACLPAYLLANLPRKHMYTHNDISIRTYTHTDTHMHMHAYTRASTRTYTNAQIPACSHARIHLHTHLSTSTYAHTHTRVHDDMHDMQTVRTSRCLGSCLRRAPPVTHSMPLPENGGAAGTRR